MEKSKHCPNVMPSIKQLQRNQTTFAFHSRMEEKKQKTLIPTVKMYLCLLLYDNKWNPTGRKRRKRTPVKSTKSSLAFKNTGSPKTLSLPAAFHQLTENTNNLKITKILKFETSFRVVNPHPLRSLRIWSKNKTMCQVFLKKKLCTLIGM